MWTLPLSALLACVGPSGRDEGSPGREGLAEDSGDTAHTAPDTGDTGALDPDDADGDGFPDWRITDDPARADCDDADPAITPATEVYVPAGPFVRGQDGLENAVPVRTITLSAYCIDRTEVTNDAFVALLRLREEAGASNLDDADQPLFDLLDADDDIPERLRYEAGAWTVTPGYEDHPVVEVWEQSAEYFCGRAGKAVPTEAQWEKAARGSTDARAYPWGDDPPDCARANTQYTEVVDGTVVGRACVGDTAPVDALPEGAGPGGVLGLAGNASEWVRDWYDPAGYASGPDVDPTGPDTPTLHDDGVNSYLARVTRGGNFDMLGSSAGVSNRFPEPEWATSNGVGFRCVRPLE